MKYVTQQNASQIITFVLHHVFFPSQIVSFEKKFSFYVSVFYFPEIKDIRRRGKRTSLSFEKQNPLHSKMCFSPRKRKNRCNCRCFSLQLRVISRIQTLKALIIAGYCESQTTIITNICHIYTPPQTSSLHKSRLS